MTLSPDEQPLTRRQLRELERQMSSKERAEFVRSHESAPAESADGEPAVPAPLNDAAPLNETPAADAESSEASPVLSDADAAAAANADQLDAEQDREDQLANDVPAPVAAAPEQAPSFDDLLGSNTSAPSFEQEPASAPSFGGEPASAPSFGEASAPSFGNDNAQPETIVAEVIAEELPPAPSFVQAQPSGEPDLNTTEIMFAGFVAEAENDAPETAEVVDAVAVPTASEVSEAIEFDEPRDDDPAPSEAVEVTIEDAPSEPVLAPIFQPAVEPSEPVSSPFGGATSFDELISSPSVGATNTSTSALVLPEVPGSNDVGTALDETGEVIITGSIDLPSSFGNSGAPSAGIESSALDALLDANESENSGSDVLPVSASRAVSSSSSTNAPSLVVPPKRGRFNVPLILAITAGILAVGVVGLLVAAFVLNLF